MPRFLVGRTSLRRMAPLVLTVGLVLAVGAVGLLASVSANRKAQEIHREDREFLQNQLGSLGDQFLQFAAKEVFDHGAAHEWELTPGSSADEATLRGFVEQSALFTHGAALGDLAGRPLTSFANDPGLPPADDPGYGPMVAGLLAQGPGLSSVMLVEDAPLVAMGVPIMDGRIPRAVLVAYFRTDTGPLQTYNERLLIAETGRGYMIDSEGTVVASGNEDAVGGPMPPSPAVDAVLAGRSGFAEFSRDGIPMIVSYSPVEFGGWAVLTEQRADEFFGPIRAGGFRTQVALLALLVVAASALMVLNHKRKEALARAYEYKGQLLANTTHELKTPLTAIRGAAMTLGVRWRDMEPDQVDQFLGIVHRRCDDLGTLIERILLGARLEAGQEIALAPEVHDLAGTLRRIAMEFAAVSPRHTIVADVPEVVWASYDERSLDQVLGLLVENAIKYSPDGGRITVSARQDDDGVLLGVADHGVGIDAEDLEHIFDPYFKASRGDTAVAGGVGLGLSIARHLVRRHGADLHVVSTPGDGTSFWFRLPAAEPPATGVVELEEATR